MQRTIEIRRDAAQATLDKFKDDEFSFASGRDCGKMINFALKQMGVAIPMAKVGNYKTLAGARAALRRAYGVTTLAEVMDLYFERIPPASALPADVIEVPGDGPVGTLTLALGNGLVIAYHEDVSGAIVGRLHEPIAAWRTLPI